MNLTEEQAKMLAAIIAYCKQQNTTAWVGDQAALNQIGGQEMLYQLERLGLINATRVLEKWIITPNKESE